MLIHMHTIPPKGGHGASGLCYEYFITLFLNEILEQLDVISDFAVAIRLALMLYIDIVMMGSKG